MGEKSGRSVRLLVVDDDELLLSAFRRAMPGRCLTSNTRDAALRVAREQRPEAALVDLQLGGDSGLDLLRELKNEDPTIAVIVISGYSSISSTVEAMRLGAHDVVPKPFSVVEIMRRFDRSFVREAYSVDTPSAERALWEHVQRVLSDSGGNKSEAARRLDKPRSWIHRFLTRQAPRN